MLAGGGGGGRCCCCCCSWSFRACPYELQRTVGAAQVGMLLQQTQRDNNNNNNNNNNRIRLLFPPRALQQQAKKRERETPSSNDSFSCSLIGPLLFFPFSLPLSHYPLVSACLPLSSSLYLSLGLGERSTASKPLPVGSSLSSPSMHLQYVAMATERPRYISTSTAV